MRLRCLTALRWAALAPVLALAGCLSTDDEGALDPVEHELFWPDEQLEFAVGLVAYVACAEAFLGDPAPAELDAGFIQVDPDARVVRASLWLHPWLGTTRTALYRDGLGCTLVPTVSATDPPDEAAIRAQSVPDLSPPPGQEALPWPTGDAGATADFADVDGDVLDAAVADAFAEAHGFPYLLLTRAVVVVYRGKIIAERYAPGFSRDSLFLSASMAKSVTNALIGRLVAAGKLDIYAPAPVPEWTAPGDPRAAITTDQLLRMSSGLRWLEGYLDPADVLANPGRYLDGDGEEYNIVNMLFRWDDAAALAAGQPLEYGAGSVWEYSSGTSNILARIVRDRAGASTADALAFPRRELFDKIGMRSAIAVPDARGTFYGSSYVYATARDWARFGLLYLRDGVWDGDRVLPAGWVDYTRTPTDAAGEQFGLRVGYGAQFWLNADTPDRQRWYPSLPEDAFFAIGYGGQYVGVVPSRDLVIVRLGLTLPHGRTWDVERHVAALLSATGTAPAVPPAGAFVDRMKLP